MKKHGDKWFRTSELHLSDVILVTQPKLNKISRRYNPRPMVITDRKGSMVTECHPKGPSKTEKLLRLPTLTTKHDPDGRHIAAATRIWLCGTYPNLNPKTRGDSRAWPWPNCPRTSTTSYVTQENHNKTKETHWGDVKTYNRHTDIRYQELQSETLSDCWLKMRYCVISVHDFCFFLDQCVYPRWGRM